MVSRASFLVSVILLLASGVFSQVPPDVRPLWDELSEKWTANDLVAAREVSNRLVEELEPFASDYSMGIQMNSALHNRASFRYNDGDYAGAEADLKRSVEQARAIQPPAGLPASAAPQLMAMVDDRVRISLRGLTNFYLAAGDLERATKSFQEALAILPLWKKQAGDDSSTGFQILAAEVSSMEGSFYRSTGDYASAMDAFLNRVEEIDGAWEMVLKMQGGKENDFSDQVKMNYLRARSNLLMEMAEVTTLQGNHTEAVGFCEEARAAASGMMPLYRKWAETTIATNPAVSKEMIEKTLAGVETNMNYLTFERAALVFRAAGDEKRALDLMLEGLRLRGEDFEVQRMLTLEYNVIRPEESLKLIGDLQAILGQFDEAASSYAKAIDLIGKQYPEGHPATLDIKESEALLALADGDLATAKEKAAKVLEERMSNLSDVLSFADESQRLSYRSSIDPWSLYATLGLPNDLYETVLRTKGIVLESILEDRGLARKASDSELAQDLLELEELRRQLMEALLGAKGETDLTELRGQIAELEGKLTEGDDSFGQTRESLKTTVAEVSRAIPKGATLIEYILYRDYSAPGRFVSRFGAILIKNGGEPQFFPLGEAAQIDKGMEMYTRAVRSNATDDEMSQLLKDFGDLIWTPFEKILPDEGDRIIISPDGTLNFFSFATLLGKDGRFLGEAWPMSYVSSGRDLLRQSDSTRNETMEIIANPDFQTPSTGAAAGQRAPGGGAAISMRGVLGRIGLSPLPGTKAEEEAVRELIRDEWKWEITSHLELLATEEAVSAVDSPGVLHLATHGFYLPRTGKADPLERAQRYWDPKVASQTAAALESFSDVVLDNPMYRSGVALAGAEATLREWGAGRIPDTSKDGILTAEEMSQLDLDGTWMVVLSACETGLGEARSGEGVLGMRRGLMQAGAKHLLLTLWPVADRETALFMIDLYRNLKGGDRSPVEMAPAVQAAYLKAFREEQGVAAAVKLAGPFILSFHP
ncbi:MAG: CHAT domain-containing protein [Verrucomicrobiales bacterium]|nr:CHAT domain-containing protein [Verrucomicrobiales bacterium]